jgi:VCBS repeat-containing protein
MTSSQPMSCTLGGGGNTAPVAIDDLYQATEDALLSVAALDGVLDNDTDAENDTLTALLVAQAIKGTVTLNPDGSFSYAPQADTCGTDQFTYRASDGQAQSAVAIATLQVACVNDAPVAATATFGVAENRAVATVVGTVSASDPDAGDTLSYAITAGNGSGAFAISGSGQITVANAAPLDFETTPQFVLTVMVSDNGSPMLSDTAQITINLSNVNEAPAIAQALADRSGQEGVAIVPFSVAGGFADPDAGDDLDFAVINLPDGLVLDTETGLISGTPAVGSAAGSVYTVDITADDGALTVSQAFQFTITIVPPQEPHIFGSGFED